MANKTPLKAKYTGSDTTALAEFESGDTLDSALLDTGTSANQIVKLDGAAKLPAVDGSALTNLPSGGGGGGGGGWSLVSTDNLSGNVGSVVISGDYSAYSQLKIVITNLYGWGQNDTRLKLSDDDGATYCSWDQYSAIVWNENGIKGSAIGWGQAYALVLDTTFKISGASANKAIMTIDIYLDGNEICYQGRADGNDTGGDHAFCISKGTGGNITSVNYIKFDRADWTSGQIRLYGFTA